MKAPNTKSPMSPKHKKQITLGAFLITGTSNPYTASQVLRRLLTLERFGLKEAKYRINGKTVIIKPNNGK